MATKMEDLSVMDLPYSPEFSETGSMCSGTRSMSMLVPEKKVDEEGLLLPVHKGANEAMLSKENMREGSFVPTDERLIEESLNEQVVEKGIDTLEIEILEIFLPDITAEDNDVLLETEGMEMEEVLSLQTEGIEVFPKAVTEVQGGKSVLAKVTGVVVRKVMAEELGTSASRKGKGKLWTEEEHRLFLMGLNIHGRGAWRSIAKNFVHTRTPTQISNHAQKHFNRQSGKRQRRRHSILDITTISETTKPQQESMYNLVNNNIQTHLNNANQPSPSAMLVPPLPATNYIQMVNNDHKFSQLPSPKNLEKNKKRKSVT